MMGTTVAPSARGEAAHLLGLDEPGRRTVHYGYVPVASRTAKPPVLTNDEAVAALASSSGRQPADDARLMEFRLRVAGAWQQVRSLAPVVQPKEELHKPSLYLVVDLRDWLERWLPGVLDALLTPGPFGPPTLSSLDGAPKAKALAAELLTVVIKRAGADQPLYEALDEVGDLTAFIADEDAAAATHRFDVSGVAATVIDALGGTGSANGGLVLAALIANEPASRVVAEHVPAELAGAIVAHADPEDPAAPPDLHVLRLVYEHEPCGPLLSKPSAVVRFAKVYEPTAPARSIRIEMPDPKDLRKFNRGVAIEMPANLRKILDRVRPEMIEGDGLGPAGGSWGLGMVCSFSIQIVFMVAFVVMFIFLILLNIVFWWMAFLKICFPIPKKQS